MLLCSSLETLPGEGTTEEIHEDVSKGFKIVAASLLNTEVSVDGGVTGSTGQILVLPVGNVKMGLRISVLFGKTEINHIDLVAALPDSHQKVVRLYIAMDKVAGVDVLNARYLLEQSTSEVCMLVGGFITYQLISEQQDRLESKFTVAKVEKVFEGRTKKVDDHCIVVTFGAEPPDKRDADATSKRFVDLGLIFELGVLGFDRLELDGNFFAGDDVDSKVDITCYD